MNLDNAFIKAYTRHPSAPQYEREQMLPGTPTNPYGEPDAYPRGLPSEGWYAAGARYRIDPSHPTVMVDPVTPSAPSVPLAYADLAYIGPYQLPTLPPATHLEVRPPSVPAPELPVAPQVLAEIPAVPTPHALFALSPTPPLSERPCEPVAQPVIAAPVPAVNEAAPAITPVARKAKAVEPSPAPPTERGAAVAEPAPDAVTARRPSDPLSPAEKKLSQLAEAEAVAALKEAAAVKIPPPLALPSIFQGEKHAVEEEYDPRPETFSPDWEVDHFEWPEVCEHLLETQDRYFQHVGKRLREATKCEHHVLMVAGSRRGEGRTTLALCLARCAAQAGVRVALLDADLENPQLGARLGMETPCSWAKVIRGQAPLNEAAVASVEDRLALFPLTEPKPGDIEPGDERLIGLLGDIASHYPLVIVDVGPLGAEDRNPFAGVDGCPVNAAIVVRDLRFTSERKALATAEQLQQSGISAVGVAENFGETGETDA